MCSPLLTPAIGFDRSAIMARAWRIARHEVTLAARWDGPTTLRREFAAALRRVWDDAKSARSLALWSIEQDHAAEARKALDARTREVAELRFVRAAADGIDSTPRFLATVTAIDSRLAELGAR